MDKPLLLRKSQVAPAANIVQKLDDLATKLRLLHEDIARHGLSEDYVLMTKTMEAFHATRASLDRKARNTFVALRRGEPVPE
jgi:hypothetical protein